MKQLILCLAGILMLTSTALAGEKKLMHCFYFTAQDGATQADWEAFYKATDELPKAIKGLTHVWYGKIVSPYLQRTHGVCMEMADAATREAYGTSPAHEKWYKVYQKVMVPGTTTFDIIGQ